MFIRFYLYILLSHYDETRHVNLLYTQALLGPPADVRGAVLKFRSRSIWVSFSSAFDMRVPTKSIKTERKNCHDNIYLCVLYIYVI